MTNPYRERYYSYAAGMNRRSARKIANRRARKGLKEQRAALAAERQLSA